MFNLTWYAWFNVLGLLGLGMLLHIEQLMLEQPRWRRRLVWIPVVAAIVAIVAHANPHIGHGAMGDLRALAWFILPALFLQLGQLLLSLISDIRVAWRTRLASHRNALVSSAQASNPTYKEGDTLVTEIASDAYPQQDLANCIEHFKTLFSATASSEERYRAMGLLDDANPRSAVHTGALISARSSLYFIVFISVLYLGPVLHCLSPN